MDTTQKKSWARWFNTAGPFLGLLLVTVMFGLSPDVRESFYTGQSWKTIFTQTVIVAIGALGMTMIIISGGIDLSVGSVVALTSVVGAKLLANQVPPFWTIVLTILAGGLIGLINGSIIAGFRLLPFVVTLGMMGVARGLAKWMANNGTVGFEGESIVTQLMASESPQTFFPLPKGVWIAVALTALVALFMQRTVFGRYIFAIGSNEATARLCGIRVPWCKMGIYGLAGLFFGVAGLMQLSRLGQGDPTGAVGLELDMIAAVVIGGASLSGGTGSVVGAVIGALVMAVLRAGSTQMALPTEFQEIIIGVVIILAVGLDKLRQKQSN